MLEQHRHYQILQSIRCKIRQLWKTTVEMVTRTWSSGVNRHSDFESDRHPVHLSGPWSRSSWLLLPPVLADAFAFSGSGAGAGSTASAAAPALAIQCLSRAVYEATMAARLCYPQFNGRDYSKHRLHMKSSSQPPARTPARAESSASLCRASRGTGRGTRTSR
jgi:hypothetical protein